MLTTSDRRNIVNSPSAGRIPLPDRTIYTLYDYRKRHATYRTDLDLLLSHSQYAWITVWVSDTHLYQDRANISVLQDDHEVADNTYRDGSSRLNNTEASFIQDGGVSVDQRKMNAGEIIKFSVLLKTHILSSCLF